MIATIIVLVNFVFSICGLVMIVKVGRMAKRAGIGEKMNGRSAYRFTGKKKKEEKIEGERPEETLSAEEIAQVLKAMGEKAV